MTDQSLLYAGIFVFSMLLIGLVLTVLEFRRMSHQEEAMPTPQDQTPLNVSRAEQ